RSHERLGHQATELHVRHAQGRERNQGEVQSESRTGASRAARRDQCRRTVGTLPTPSSQATTHSIKETTMKTSFIVLTAALATVAFAPRANAQGTNKMTFATASKAASTDTMSPAVIQTESTTVDTVKKTAVTKRKMSFLSTAPGV